MGVIKMSYSSGCGYSTGGCNNYSSLNSMLSSYSAGYSSQSGLEYTISNSEIAEAKEIEFNPLESGYKQKKYFDGYLTNSKLTRTYNTNSPFVLQDIETKFVGDVAEISDYVEKAFRKVTGEEFPDDIIIHVCSKEKLREFHQHFGGAWNNGINGFAVNRKKSGLKSEIFVAQGQLSNIMATLGHEIGHCLSVPLDNMRDEEAKAFAFEFAWVKIVDENNIAGLKGCFNLNHPAKNNIHDKAFSFVSQLVQKGADAIKVCFRLISGELSLGGEW